MFQKESPWNVASVALVHELYWKQSHLSSANQGVSPVRGLGAGYTPGAELYLLSGRIS